MKNKAVIFILTLLLLCSVNFDSMAFSFGGDDEEETEVAKTEKNEKEAEENKIATEASSGEFTRSALLQGLNKITTKTSELPIEVGASAKFGELDIKVYKCWKSAPDQRPESKVLMEVYDNANGKRNMIFYGWMFASTPSISGLEHPIYDITVLKCR